MAEAKQEVTQSTSELDIRAQLAQSFEQTLIEHMANENLRLAKTRTEGASIEIGTVDIENLKKEQNYVLRENEQVVATFGRSKSVKKGGLQIIESAPIQQSHELDLPKIAQNTVNNVKTFDIDSEFKKLRSITDLDERENAAQLLYMNIGQQATVAQDRIRSIAAQRSGVYDAQAALDQNIALDISAVQTGRIKPGDTTVETRNARTALQAALQTANQYEADLIKRDPDIQKYDGYAKLLMREFGQIDRQQDRKTSRDAQLPVLTDDRLANGKYALNLPTTNSGKLINEVGGALAKDKALQVVIDATKQDYPGLLVHPDAKVRRYAFNIIAAKERENLGLSPDEKLPGYIEELEKLVTDRTSILRNPNLSAQSKEAIKQGEKKKGAAIGGEKEKSEITTSTLLQVLNKEIEETASKKYQRMDLWSFTDPQFKQIVDTLKTNSLDKDKKKGSQVLMTDGVTEIMKAELKNPDGTKMTPQQKINTLVNSLNISMTNDQGSVILPSVENFGAVMASQVRNTAMAAYVRIQLFTPSNLTSGYEVVKTIYDVQKGAK